MGRYLVHRSDGNQSVIIQALQAVGAQVYPLGQPVDLLVGYKGRNWLLEVKTARGRLRNGQGVFLASWAGQAAVVRSVDDALDAIGVKRR